MLSKIVPVVGNVCDSDLGLDDDLADLISKQVDIIVNSAANTTFDERFITLLLLLLLNSKQDCVTFRIVEFN